MSELATRDQILCAGKRRFREVEVPGWGAFRIRSMTELERSRFEASILDKKGQVASGKLVDQKCRLIVLCVVDENGDPLLTNNDIDTLRQVDSAFTNKLVEAIQEHCGFSDRDWEEITKN